MNLSKTLGSQYWGLLGGMGLLGLLLGGCASAPPEKFVDLPGIPGVTNATPTSPSTSENTIIDVIQPGMPLLISITDTPTLVAPILDQVKQDGTITLLLNKTFVAAGKTRRQLEQEVHKYYVPDYYKQMTISIQPREQTRFYFVDGEVKSAGQRVYMGPMTVLKAVASASGFTDFANKRKVKLIHPNGRIQIVNCVKAIDMPAQDLPVYPDDKVIVPRRLFW